MHVNVRFEDETVCLTQAAMVALFDVAPQNVTMHLQNIYADGEQVREATCKDFLQVQNEGGREVSRRLKHYKLDAILALNGRELLTHAGTISHQLAEEISAKQLSKFRQRLTEAERIASLDELENDLKKKRENKDVRK